MEAEEVEIHRRLNVNTFCFDKTNVKERKKERKFGVYSSYKRKRNRQ